MSRRPPAQPLTLTDPPRRVHYLLEGTERFGGVKVALHQAHLLARRGVEVAVLSKGPRPDWFPVEVPFEERSSFEGLTLPPEDLCVATFWTTLEPAARSGARAVHYCQGWEGSYTHNRAEHGAIEEAYRLPLPAMTVAPHLAEMVQKRFGRSARVVTQPLQPFFVPGEPHRRAPDPRPRVLVLSPFEIDWKGVETALQAVALLRRQGLDLELVRISQWPMTEEERAITAVDAFHTALDPEAVARLLASVDLLFAPSWEQEGFGLPVLEAMACGVPVVCSDIPPFRWFAGDAAALAPPRDAAAFARAAEALLTDPGRWRRHRRAGLAAAGRFTEARAARDAETVLAWAAAGAPTC